MIAPGIQAIIFDAIGTLLHPEPPAADVYAEVGRTLGSRYSAAAIVERFADAFAREEQADEKAGWHTSEARELRRWANIVARVLDDVSDPPRCFRLLYEHFARAESWRCEPAAGRLLAELARRGFRLGMASNYDHRLLSVVAGFAELQPVRHLIISAEVGWRKPALGFFTAICQALAAPPEKILYIGDDITNDYDGATAAGLAALLYDPQGQERGTRINRLERLNDLLSA
jgi:putative hydrolase of the HAD superfamily